MSERIYVIEDDENIQEIIKLSLESSGYQITLFNNAIDAIVAIHEDTPDLAIFDVMLPELDGISAIKQIRKTNTTLPILILSAKDREIDKVRGLDSGCDDYMTKPFGVLELAARVRSLLRRSQHHSKVIKTTSLEIDKSKHIILKQGLNRQIRRMCAACGYRVETLKRIRIMNIHLGNIPQGNFRNVTDAEFDKLIKTL